jgi:DNA-binding CsgD family transcriptional regulator
MSDERKRMPISSPEHSEFLSGLSGADAIGLLEIIHQGLSCSTEKDFIGLFPKLQQLFPFDFAGALLGGVDEGNELVIAHGVNISFPSEWLSEYLAKGYFHQDVVTKETFRICRPGHWSYEMKKYEVPKEIKSLNMDLGMTECYTHGASRSNPGQYGAMFCFTGPSIKYDRRAISALAVVVPHLHLVLSNIFSCRQSNNNCPVLTAREKEVLNWLKHGKSSWDISVILGISESTANYHVYNIMRKLDASNRPQAVAIAVRLGLTSLD